MTEFRLHISRTMKAAIVVVVVVISAGALTGADAASIENSTLAHEVPGTSGW